MQKKWLSPEVMTMFLYHHMRALDSDEELQVLESLVGGIIYEYIFKRIFILILNKKIKNKNITVNIVFV